MAGVIGVVQTAEIASGTSKKTVLQILAGSNQRVKLREVSISFKGTSGSQAPILVQVLRQTSAGAGGDAQTPLRMNESDDVTLRTTALVNIDGSEPTGTDELLSEEVHPQGGYSWQAPWGGEIIIKSSNRVGVAVTAGASTTCVARFIFEE